MKMLTPVKNPRGRPRNFAREVALENAMVAFWSKGYAGTTLDDLTAAMGVNRPSLYGAFGDKRSLFIESIDHYVATRGQRAIAALASADTIEVGVAKFLNTIIDGITGTECARGCMMVSVAGDAAQTDAGVRARLDEVLHATDMAIAATIRRFTGGKRVSAEAKAEHAAWLLSAGVHSLALRARAGAEPAELHRMARVIEQAVFASLRAEPKQRRGKGSVGAA